MRLAVCALSAVLLSGCSWLGGGGSSFSDGFGASNGSYGANCAPGQAISYGQYGQDVGCAGGAYGVGQGFAEQGFGGQGFAGQGFGQAGFGPGAVGAGLAAQGIGGQFNGAGFGGNGVTTLGAAAPFGAAAFGGGVIGSQLNNGQFVNGAAVQNVVGAPIFVPQPFAAPFGVPQLRGVGAALPFGFEVFGGTEFDIGGTLASRKEVSPSFGGGGLAGTFPAVSYSDAFSDGYTLGGAGTFDVSRNTTLIGQASFSQKDGRTVDTGSFQSGTFDSAGVFTPDIGSATPRNLVGEFSDLEQYTLEAGVRQYVGNNSALRPYVGATGGFTYNNDVDLRQTFVDDGSVFDDSQFIESGWRPTAAGIVGAEMAVGPRSAIGIESGIRWRDNLNANSDADDRWSIPLKLRGRVAF